MFSFTTLVVTIGFNKTAYSVSEDAGSVSITLSVQTGTLDRDVILNLSTINGTGMCEFQSVAFEAQHLQVLKLLKHNIAVNELM